jgi:hypothetical protein
MTQRQASYSVAPGCGVRIAHDGDEWTGVPKTITAQSDYADRLVEAMERRRDPQRDAGELLELVQHQTRVIQRQRAEIARLRALLAEVAR